MNNYIAKKKKGSPGRNGQILRKVQYFNNPITSTEIEAVIKISQKTKAQDQMASQENSSKHLEKS